MQGGVSEGFGPGHAVPLVSGLGLSGFRGFRV